jgi:nucleotide-binding universal stress UspA family protein
MQVGVHARLEEALRLVVLLTESTKRFVARQPVNTSTGGTMFDTVVLALDGSASSDKALGCATALAQKHASSVHVVHVIELTVGRGGGRAPIDEAELQAKVEGQVKSLIAAGVKAQLEVHKVPAGGPAHVIEEVAQSTAADLIITGTRGHTPAVGILLGSVPQRLLHLAHCPVLVVPLAD